MLRFGLYLFVTVAFLALAGAGGSVYLLFKYGPTLPEFEQLASYEPPTVTRVHAGDGRLIAEFARERRMFVPIDAIPKRIIQAVLAAEDKAFYEHYGIDPSGILRAAITNLRGMGGDRRPVGGSTITQQVAKNFLLTNEVSFERKIKEAILSFRIERAIPKDRILELYLNEIYLGLGSYGVAAAALNYFNKSMNDLTLPEIAYLAALPKAPNNYHPIRKREAAIWRRNWVIGRMREDGHLAAQEAKEALAAPFEVRPRSDTEFVFAPYFAEDVRREIMERYGEQALYGGGLSVRTTLDPRLQDIARRSLRAGLIAYDRRHGWRGAFEQIPFDEHWQARLTAIKAPNGLGDWRLAVVRDVADDAATIGFVDGSGGKIPFSEVQWARQWRENQRLGKKVKKLSDVLLPGDVIAVEALGEAEQGGFGLRQIPQIQGAVVALDPHTGRVLAMVGGYDFAASEFNRATQAWRQPGSAFKPFVYAAALENGFTPASLILDGPFVIDQGPGLGKWKPANYTKKFYGPSTLRLGVEKSRNLMTVRLAHHLGIETVADYAERFDVVDELPLQLSMALGSAETTLMRLTAGYAMLVNGGRHITPTLIDRIQDRRGKTIYRHDKRACEACRADAWEGQSEPKIPDDRRQLIDPATAHQLVSILQGVVQRGTGRRVRDLDKPLGGKTGTTNQSFDAWFLGFSPDLTFGVFTGFDSPRTLGRREQGASVAAPIFKSFMKAALAGQPGIPFRVPPGIRLVRVDAATGLPARDGAKNVILEAFRPGTEPSEERTILDGSESIDDAGGTPGAGTGGLY